MLSVYILVLCFNPLEITHSIILVEQVKADALIELVGRVLICRQCQLIA